jgi:hypothetical protein
MNTGASKALVSLLERSFDPQRLREFVDLEFGKDISVELPGPGVSLATLAFEVTEAWRRHGVVRLALTKLREKRPNRGPEIDAIEQSLERAESPSSSPRLAVSEERIELHLGPGETVVDEVIDVFNEGGGELEWTVRTSDDWVEVEQHADHFKVRMHPKPGMNRAKLRVQSQNGGGVKVVRLVVEVARRTSQPAPSPAPAPAPPAPVPSLDIAGNWAGVQGGLVRFIGTPPNYEVHELNGFGQIVGQGAATLTGTTVNIRVNNAMMGLIDLQLQVMGNTMGGVVNLFGVPTQVLYQRVG